MWLQLTNQNDQAINTDHVRRFKRGKDHGAYTIYAVSHSGIVEEIYRGTDEVERDNKYYELLNIINAVDW